MLHWPSADSRLVRGLCPRRRSGDRRAGVYLQRWRRFRARRAGGPEDSEVLLRAEESTARQPDWTSYDTVRYLNLWRYWVPLLALSLFVSRCLYEFKPIQFTSL